MTKPNQSKQELQVVKSFLKHYPCKIKISSIKKRYPPEPDIECKLENGETISFELVECVDNRIKKKWSDYIKLRNLLKIKIRNLSDKDRQELHRKYYGTNILVVFNDNFSIRKKEKSIPRIVKYILKRKNDISGVIEVKSIKEVKEISITRKVEYDKGPDIDLPGIVTNFEEYSLKMIKNKFGKNYQTDNKIELIAYYHYQHDITVLGKNNFIKTINFIEENISQTSFTRVWLYSYTSDKVLYNFEIL